MTKYWLLEWLDDEGVTKIEQARQLLETEKGFERLIQRADAQCKKHPEALPEAYQQLVAGSGLDLTGHFSCYSADCARGMVDQLVLHAWHSFEKVVVTGFDASYLIDGLLPAAPREHTLRVILVHVDVALYIRATGAERMFIFVNKPMYCEEHLDVHAKECGLNSISYMARQLSTSLQNGCHLAKYVKNGRTVLKFEHPSLTLAEISVSNQDLESVDNEELKKKWADGYSRSVAATLVANTVLARLNGAALGQITGIGAEQVLPMRKSRRATKPTTEDVAFHISLPFVEGLPIKEILAVRDHEATQFQAFQVALRASIQARIDSLGSVDAARIADSVVDDVLEPAIIELDRKVSRAGELLAQRSGVAIAIGTVVTTVGLLAFAPLAAPGIVIAAGGVLASANDFLKDKKDVKLSDMHFLWRLANRSHHHG